MKVNNENIFNASFLVYDKITKQDFGGRIEFNGGSTEKAFPDLFYFSTIEELSNLISLLNDIYERAIKYRNKLEKEKKSNDEVYTIICPKCGIISNNNSPLYCDYCHNPINKIKIGEFWYDAEELEQDNIFN